MTINRFSPPQAFALDEYPLRYVIIHIHPVSARLRFLISQKPHLCLPKPLPKLSDLLSNAHNDAKVVNHPSSYIHDCCALWKIPEKDLAVVPEFKLWVDTPRARLPVYCLHVDAYQPFIAPAGTAWIDLPDCFELSSVERQIMQEIYKWLLE
jgi:hypothetical protein